MAEKNDILDIVRGISTAAARGYDGALDSDGQPLKIGLKREEGDLVLDKRIIDGFKASISGNVLIIKYQAEIMLKDVYKGDFEGEVEQRMKDIVSFLKKEYKKITGNALTLTKDDEPDVLVQSISKVRTIVNATQNFKIGGIPEQPELGTTVEERLSTAIKDWIGFGKDKFANTKNPSNVKGKRDEEPRS
jgi:effector-binding domain-containing protein